MKKKDLWLPISAREQWGTLPSEMRPSRKRRDGRDILERTIITDSPAAAHTHTESDVTDLGTYSAVGHSHTESDVSDLDHTDTDAIHDNVSGEISLLTEKVTPVSADLLIIEDSAASNAKKKVQIGNLPSSGGGGGGDIYALQPWMKPPDTAHADDVEFSDYADTTDPVLDHGWLHDGAGGNDHQAINGGMLTIWYDGVATNRHDWVGVIDTSGYTGDFDVTAYVDVKNLYEDAYAEAGFTFIWSGSYGAGIYDHYVAWKMSYRGGWLPTYDTSTFSSQSHDLSSYDIGPDPALLRLEWDDTTSNVYFSYSTDGFNFVRHMNGAGDATVAMSSWGVPDAVGLYTKNYSSYGRPMVTCQWMRVNWTCDYDAGGVL